MVRLYSKWNSNSSGLKIAGYNMALSGALSLFLARSSESYILIIPIKLLQMLPVHLLADSSQIHPKRLELLYSSVI